MNYSDKSEGDGGGDGCYEGIARASDTKCDNKKSKKPRIEDLPYSAQRGFVLDLSYAKCVRLAELTN